MTDRKVTVRELVSGFCSENPDPVSAGLLRRAFVAHTMFFNEVGGSTVQVAQLMRSSVSDPAAIVALLRETYSRAVFETAFALHFDRADVASDRALLNVIAEAYDLDVALAVHREVAARGVVLMHETDGELVRTTPQQRAGQLAEAAHRHPSTGEASAARDAPKA